MKISGFVGLDTADALKYVKIWSEDLIGPLIKALKKAQNKVQIGGPLCEQTERDRDMKISGFVNLDWVDALKYVKI